MVNFLLSLVLVGAVVLLTGSGSLAAIENMA
jgi:hypothetical protein